MTANESNVSSDPVQVTATQIQLRYSVLVTVLLVTSLVIVALVTAVGNLLVIISIFTYRPLKNAQNVLLVSLAIADIGVAVLVMPLSIVDTTVEPWFLGYGTCTVWTTCDVLFCTASILNLCCIGIDRFEALHNPLEYAHKRTVTRMVVMILVAYGLSALISIPPLFFWQPKQANDRCELSGDPLYVMVSASVSFFIPSVIMCAVYSSIYCRMRTRLRKRSSACAAALTAVTNTTASRIVHTKLATPRVSLSATPSHAQLQVNSLPQVGLRKSHSSAGSFRTKAVRILRLKVDQSSSSDDDIVVSERNQAAPNAIWQQAITLTLLPPIAKKSDESNTFATRQKIYLSRERKAAKILGLLIATFMASWIPFFLLYIMTPWCTVCQTWHRNVGTIVTWIGYANSTCNPILYTIFNADFRKAFKKLLMCRETRKKTQNLAKIWRAAADLR